LGTTADYFKESSLYVAVVLDIAMSCLQHSSAFINCERFLHWFCFPLYQVVCVHE